MEELCEEGGGRSWGDLLSLPGEGATTEGGWEGVGGSGMRIIQDSKSRGTHSQNAANFTVE